MAKKKATPPAREPGFHPGRLAKARAALKFSLFELSKRTDVAPSTLSRIEHGKKEIKLQTAVRIARGLDISLDFLCGMSDDPRVR